jgi:hypothetical protein
MRDGEGSRTFFEPEVLRDELQRAGFAFATDFGPEELNRRYFTNRRDRLRVGSMGHIAMAGTLGPDAPASRQVTVGAAWNGRRKSKGDGS